MESRSRISAIITFVSIMLYTENSEDHMKLYPIASIYIPTLSKPHPVKPKHIKKPRTIEQILRNPLGG
jgi:hypothetical protein